MQVNQIEIHAGSVDFEHEPVRLLEAKCEAKTIYSPAPTMEQVNVKLQEMAAGIGANAVINVKYTNGMSMTSWRSMTGAGLAVRKLSDEIACPVCAEKIKRAAAKCRFCGAELAGRASGAAAPALASTSTRRSPAGRPPSHPRPHVPREPLRATDNSISPFLVIVGIVVALAILGAIIGS